MTPSATAYLLLAVLVIGVSYSTWAESRQASTPGCTISEVVHGAARAQPIVALALGILAGHWMPFSHAWFDRIREWSRDNLGWLLVAGVIVGSIWWPVRR